MAINFFNAEELEQKLKCTVHKSGKLGFSDGATKRMKLGDNTRVKIGYDEADGEKGSVLYMQIDNSGSPQGFKVNKAGAYYYLNTKALFDRIGIKYSDKGVTIIYDITELDGDNAGVYKLIKREAGRNKRE